MTRAIATMGVKCKPRSFPLGGLPKADIACIREATVRIRERLNRQRDDFIETGKDLLKVKDKLEHGKFERWLDHEFTLSVRSAQLFMNAARWVTSLAADKCETVSHLSQKSIFLLSAPSTPAAVRERVIEEIEKTGRAEPVRIKMMIQEAKADTKGKVARARRRQRKQAISPRTARARERESQRCEEERQRREQANIARAKELAGVLARRLNTDEMSLLLDAINNWPGRAVLRDEIDKAQVIEKHTQEIGLGIGIPT